MEKSLLCFSKNISAERYIEIVPEPPIDSVKLSQFGKYFE